MQRDDLVERLVLIEQLAADARRSMASWGWAFLLWGVGHLVAAIWSLVAPEHGGLPWIITMPLCGIVMTVGALRTRALEGKATPIDRAVGGVWLAFAGALVLSWIVGGWRDLYPDGASFLFAFYVIAGAASFASGWALQLTSQLLVSAGWWAAAVATVLAPAHAFVILIAAALVCEIGFGLVIMRSERSAYDRDQAT